jgi:hypothetical protein
MDPVGDLAIEGFKVTVFFLLLLALQYFRDNFFHCTILRAYSALKLLCGFPWRKAEPAHCSRLDGRHPLTGTPASCAGPPPERRSCVVAI